MHGQRLQRRHRSVRGSSRRGARPATRHRAARAPSTGRALSRGDGRRNAGAGLGRRHAEAWNSGGLHHHRPGAPGALAAARSWLPDVRLLGPRRHQRGRRRQDGGQQMRRLHNIGRLFTGTQAGVIQKAAIICDDDEHIAWCGREGEEPRDLLGYIAHDEDCGGGVMTAGLIDAHTHPVYAGNRMAEVGMRSAGASYEEVAKAGGGIVATVKATRATTPEALEQATADRLRRWLDGGATTVEAKTGYHLEREGELEATRILKRLSERNDLPRIEPTFLAAHATPPDRGARLGSYAKKVAGWCADAHVAGARFCDVFCDRGYFSVSQSRRILKAALEAQLIPRLHADELARTRGSRLSAELRAGSAGHLLPAHPADAGAPAP